MSEYKETIHKLEDTAEKQSKAASDEWQATPRSLRIVRTAQRSTVIVVCAVVIAVVISLLLTLYSRPIGRAAMMANQLAAAY
jgi:hypothetical protein